jgi:hypothetical protein
MLEVARIESPTNISETETNASNAKAIAKHQIGSLPQPSRRMARLLWRDAQGNEGALELSSSEIKIGRAVDCAIRTDDAMVSRHHSRVFCGDSGYVLEDLSSANGVFFNKKRVQSHILTHGDAVLCGSLWVRFVESDRATVDPTPAVLAVGTGHVSPVQAQPPSSSPPAPAGPSAGDVEIRVLRRRIEQAQVELRVYRTNKFSQETARRMEDLENDLSMMEIERDNLKSVQVRRAREIAAEAETLASLNDVLSSMRIEVMAAECEFEQHSQAIPRASFELIRQSLKDGASHCDEARELLRKLREVPTSV